MFSRLMKRGQPSVERVRSRGRLELVFYRGDAKTATLGRVFGLQSVDALWAGIYLNGSSQETLSLDREVLEALTPPYASISFTLPTNDPGEHRDAMAALDLEGIRYDESIGSESALEGTQSPSEKVFWLSGATLNQDIYRLVFEVMYDPPTLVSHRFVFTISPSAVNPEVNSHSQRTDPSNSHWKILVSTYYWKGLQLISRELREESVEQLAQRIAAEHKTSLVVRNR